MTRYVLLATLLFALAQTACSTVYFHNGANSGNDVGPDRLHHIVLGSIEVVEPVDLSDRCNGRGWETVKTERTFLAGLIGSLVSPIYTPWGVAWKCKP
jgi:hypothetical protein